MDLIQQLGSSNELEMSQMKWVILKTRPFLNVWQDFSPHLISSESKMNFPSPPKPKLQDQKWIFLPLNVVFYRMWANLVVIYLMKAAQFSLGKCESLV